MMRYLSLLLLLGTLAGCTTSMDPEERRFYNRGWLNPHRDIDLDPNFDAPAPDGARMPREVHPEKYKQDPFNY